MIGRSSSKPSTWPSNGNTSTTFEATASVSAFTRSNLPISAKPPIGLPFAQLTFTDSSRALSARLATTETTASAFFSLAAFVKQAFEKRWSDSLSSISASAPSTAASPGFAFLGGSRARR